MDNPNIHNLSDLGLASDKEMFYLLVAVKFQTFDYVTLV